jgi:hypothetical protein
MVAQRSRQLIASVAVAICLCVGVSHAQSVAGIARVVDGDTLEVADTKIRLEGIDAPETKQVCIAGSGEEYACGVNPFSLRVQKGFEPQSIIDNRYCCLTKNLSTFLLER